VNTFVPRRVSGVSFAVPRIPATVRQPQVATSIVQAVAVDVVHLKSGGRLQDYPVHEDPLAFFESARIPTTAKMPAKFCQVCILLVNQGVSGKRTVLLP
jgi:hypothetical protein